MSLRVAPPIFLLVFALSARLYAQPVDVLNITIARDNFGVPHIFAKTDAEAAYGLAWAHSEDDFKHIQQNLLAARGRLGEVLGKDGVLFDFGLQFLGIDTLVDQLYDKNLSADFKKVVEGYTQALNDYAKKFPKEVLLKNALPFTPKDVIKGYTLNLSLMSGIGVALKTIKANKIEMFSDANDDSNGSGSNAIVIAPSRTEDGKTWLAVNSHQPLEGRFAWYEAHVNSEQGWNMIGGLFPGGLSIFVGTNPNLGWAHTTNYNTWGDIHELQLNPANKLQYKLDGVWKDFKVRKAKLKVKIAGIKIPIKKRMLNSEFGPVFETKHGFYSLRFPAYSEMRAAEQWFRMNKANNWKEFESAIKMEAIPSFNIIYGDKEGNIFYQCSGHYPKRNPELSWKQPIREASSKYKWTELEPYENKPTYFNPECGYLYNANNTPLHASGDDCQWEKLFPGLQLFEYNRGQRLAELMNPHQGNFTWNDFIRIKYDKAYSNKGLYAKNFAAFYNLDEKKYPEIADYIRVLKAWDLTGTTDSKGAALAMVAHKKLAERHDAPFGFFMIRKEAISEEDAVTAIREAKRFLMNTHGTIDVKLQDVQRHIRGEKSLPVSGLAEVLRAADIKLHDKKKGIYRVTSGDGYIQLNRYGKDGSIEVNSINSYGASSHPNSKHYNDQMELFVAEKTKKMTFDKNEILSKAERIYHPGQ